MLLGVIAEDQVDQPIRVGEIRRAGAHVPAVVADAPGVDDVNVRAGKRDLLANGWSS
ncbi:MAG: hypothetical protein U0521_23275 [Anaerolineae bacterium]